MPNAFGGGRHRYFSGELNERSRRWFSVERELRQALEREELEVRYQPKILLDTGEMAGVEALLRWTNPQLGAVHHGLDAVQIVGHGQVER